MTPTLFALITAGLPATHPLKARAETLASEWQRAQWRLAETHANAERLATLKREADVAVTAAREACELFCMTLEDYQQKADPDGPRL